jgi:AraC-like DNA-binding protein
VIAPEEAGSAMGGAYREQADPSYYEARQLGHMEIFEFYQPEGQVVKPALDLFLLQVILSPGMNWSIRLGEGEHLLDMPFPGEMSLSIPGLMITCMLDGGAHGIGLELDGPWFRDVARRLDPDFPGHFGSLHAMFWRDNGLRDFVLKLWRAAKGDAWAPPVDAEEAGAALARLLLDRAAIAPDRREVDYALAPHVRRKVFGYIEDNLDGDCSILALADVAGLSPYHFARAFRTDTGDTPHRYVVRRRLVRARDMVLYSSLGLAEIARATGYSSQSRLTEAFVRNFGTTPGQTRRAWRERS